MEDRLLLESLKDYFHSLTPLQMRTIQQLIKGLSYAGNAKNTSTAKNQCLA